MNTKPPFPVSSIVLLLVAGLPAARAADPAFQHHFIAREIPQQAASLNYGTPVLADFDKDGDLDFAVCATREILFWFENTGPDNWVRHIVGRAPTIQLAACALDVDRDGWTDIVIGGVWYRNPRQPRSKEFTRFTYDSKIVAEIHDLVPADVDGDGSLDVVALGDREGCFWYSIPANPAKDDPWPRHLITDLVLDQKDDIHGGFSPRGVGDLDGDGDADLVLPNRWLENVNKGAQWAQHPLPFGRKKGPWGLSSRSWIADMDRDGDMDIVIVDCDQQDSSAAWLENNGARQPTFTPHPLPRTAPGVRGSFHSLAVADFDGDGDLDIVTVEQEDPSILPTGASPRWYLWENLDGKAGRFAERILLDAKIGGHDILIGDIDGDGDIDIASKIWRLWPGNANAGRFHADWLENRLRDRR